MDDLIDGIPKTDAFTGEQFNQPVTLEGAHAMLHREPVTEADFMPHNVIPLEQEARDERKLRRLAQNPTKLLVKGGKRVVKLKINVPADQYKGLQRFEGDTDADKINAIIRMANRRVDEWQRDEARKQREQALAPRGEPAPTLPDAG